MYISEYYCEFAAMMGCIVYCSSPLRIGEIPLPRKGNAIKLIPAYSLGNYFVTNNQQQVLCL